MGERMSSLSKFKNTKPHKSSTRTFLCTGEKILTHKHWYCWTFTFFFWLQIYLLSIIDRSTRWPEVIPLRGITTPECVHALITGWIARFGVPGDISSDRGSQFTSSLWSEIAARLGVKLHHTSAYHPQANGMIERFYRTLKTALKARLTGPNWVEELPWALLELRTTPKEDLGYSSAELVYDEPLTIPGELVSPISAKSMDDLLLILCSNIPLYTPRPVPPSHFC